MSLTPPGKYLRFNPPPTWPAPPPGWIPPSGWVPDPSWPPPPEGWQLWIEDPNIADTMPGAVMRADSRQSRTPPRWAIIAGTVVIGLIIANVTSGLLGHLTALLVWAGAGWLCVRPARVRIASVSRTSARIGVAVCTCFAVYAASLAIVDATGHSGSVGGGTCDLSVTNIQWALTSQVSVAAQGASCDNTANAVEGYMDSVNSSAGNAGGYNVVAGTAGGSVQCQFVIEGDPITVYVPDKAELCGIFGG